MASGAYYNENDPFAAQWLRNLIAGGMIAPGEVDERDIQDVLPDDLMGYEQCHFFAGIGGWSYALRLAGWPDDQPVWTGSCPCQPFSTAGKGKGFADERHLWPAWFHLIQQRKPSVVFGEQVKSPAGRAWLDLVQTDMEGAGYAFAPAGVAASSVGAPHPRERLWFAADVGSKGLPRGNECKYIRGQAKEFEPWRELIRVHAARGWREWDAQSRIRVFMDGVPGRVGQIRGYGNAIVPQVAAEVIAAFMEVRP